MKTKYTKDLLENAVDGSISVMEVLDKLNLKRAGGNHTHISKMIKHYGINTSHFLGQASTRGKSPVNKHTKESFMEIVLKENGSDMKGSWIRKKLIEFEIKEDVCEICGQGNKWNGKSLTLQIDHINGNNRDNNLDNLRIVCPNCHTQTETWGINNSRKNNMAPYPNWQRKQFQTL